MTKKVYQLRFTSRKTGKSVLVTYKTAAAAVAAYWFAMNTDSDTDLLWTKDRPRKG
jgi:hypothetical protein